MTDPRLVAAEKWFGYGRWQAPYWFVGMRQGGTDDKRYDALLAMGVAELVDCREHHLHHLWNCTVWHVGAQPRRQPTWRCLICCLLAFKGEMTDIDRAAISRYQRDRWGAADGETAVMEIGALHARSEAECTYHDLFRQKRIELIGRQLRRCRPVFAVIYGKDSHPHYERIISTSFDQSGFANCNGTLCVLAPHPRRRPAYAYWRDLGSEMRARLAMGSAAEAQSP